MTAFIETWTKVPWDGNPALGYECWRKPFDRGHVSVGVGSFDLIVYSYGASSEDSMSSTRWRGNGVFMSEQEAMDMVDRNGGKYNNKDN
jgi:hypothetical protein